jgi:hypothetical protein
VDFPDRYDAVVLRRGGVCLFDVSHTNYTTDGRYSSIGLFLAVPECDLKHLVRV